MKKLLVGLGVFAAAMLLINTGASLLGNSTDDTANDNTAENIVEAASADGNNWSVATFAGGCFWCIESTFEKLSGVKSAVSGYAGGTTDNPTYNQVSGGRTGHTETVQIYYDPNEISYEALLHHFWRDIDPTDSNGQFVDRGSEYRPAIFYHNETERQLAIQSKQALEDAKIFDKPVTVEVVPFEKFYTAESYHQDYHKKSPLRYKLYRNGSGRDKFLQRVWGDTLNQPYAADKNS